jgi:hypothetical protein
MVRHGQSLTQEFALGRTWPQYSAFQPLPLKLSSAYYSRAQENTCNHLRSPSVRLVSGWQRRRDQGGGRNAQEWTVLSGLYQGFL